MDKVDWVRTMRLKHGLKGFQLAERLQVSAARVSMLEKDETRGALTLKMMERVAKAMDCRFEYRIVPLQDKQVAVDENGSNNTAKPRVRVIVK
jgi:transcriptional regulator with XRE-family HTH domain